MQSMFYPPASSVCPSFVYPHARGTRGAVMALCALSDDALGGKKQENCG